MKKEDRDKLFQLELERFRMKSTWENRIFYSGLGLIVGVILVYVKNGEMDKTIFQILLLILALFLIIGEVIVNKVLNNEKEEIAKKFNLK